MCVFSAILSMHYYCFHSIIFNSSSIAHLLFDWSQQKLFATRRLVRVFTIKVYQAAELEYIFRKAKPFILDARFYNTQPMLNDSISSLKSRVSSYFPYLAENESRHKNCIHDLYDVCSNFSAFSAIYRLIKLFRKSYKQILSSFDMAVCVRQWWSKSLWHTNAANRQLHLEFL